MYWFGSRVWSYLWNRDAGHHFQMVLAPQLETPLFHPKIRVPSRRHFRVQFLPTKWAPPPPLSRAPLVWMTTMRQLWFPIFDIRSLLLSLLWGYQIAPLWPRLCPRQLQETPNQSQHGTPLSKPPWHHPSTTITTTIKTTLSLRLLPRLAPHTATFMPRPLFPNVTSLIPPLLSLASGWTSKHLDLLFLQCLSLPPWTLSNLLRVSSTSTTLTTLITVSKRWETQKSNLECRWSPGLGRGFMKVDWMIWSSH